MSCIQLPFWCNIMTVVKWTRVSGVCGSTLGQYKTWVECEHKHIQCPTGWQYYSTVTQNRILSYLVSFNSLFRNDFFFLVFNLYLFWQITLTIVRTSQKITVCCCVSQLSVLTFRRRSTGTRSCCWSKVTWWTVYTSSWVQLSRSSTVYWCSRELVG